MTGWTTRGIVEGIGLLGVIGSLIFVGVEVRQNSVDTRASANATVADSFRDLAVLMASSPQLARAIVAAGDDPESIEPADQVVLLSFFRAVFHSWSNVYRQQVNGTLDPAIYESLIQELRAYAGTDGEHLREEIARRGQGVRWAWESERYLFNEDFQYFIDETLGVQR